MSSCIENRCNLLYSAEEITYSGLKCTAACYAMFCDKKDICSQLIQEVINVASNSNTPFNTPCELSDCNKDKLLSFFPKQTTEIASVSKTISAITTKTNSGSINSYRLAPLLLLL
jgi:hypothetical protein